MKKRILLFLLLICSVVCFVACGDNSQDNGKENFTNITFSNIAVDYDGEEHTITAGNIPSFATVNYANAGPYVDAGSYIVTAKITAEGYNDLTLKATLTINKVNFNNSITMEDKTVTYDGESKSIDVSNIPSYASVEYVGDKEYTNAGEYTISVKVFAKNYNDLSLSA